MQVVRASRMIGRWENHISLSYAQQSLIKSSAELPRLRDSRRFTAGDEPSVQSCTNSQPGKNELQGTARCVLTDAVSFRGRAGGVFRIRTTCQASCVVSCSVSKKNCV